MSVTDALILVVAGGISAVLLVGALIAFAVISRKKAEPEDRPGYEWKINPDIRYGGHHEVLDELSHYELHPRRRYGWEDTEDE